MNRIINWVVKWVGNRPKEITDDLDMVVKATLNDFLMRPEVEAILLDINADLQLYGQVTQFNKNRMTRALGEYVLEVSPQDKD